MKVYAHYCEDSQHKEIKYRWRTLLQFGSSWNIIGSIVMLNPGSSKTKQSKPIIDSKTIKKLDLFDQSENWYEFTTDPTMGLVEQLFSIYYGQNTKEEQPLNGVIQVFNLFNIMDARPDSAIRKIKEIKSASHHNLFTIENDIKELKAPIYLGWGGFGNNPVIISNAQRFFEVTLHEYSQNYLDKEFSNNLFYHPRFLLGLGRYNPNSVFLLNAFCQNTLKPTCEIQTLPKYTFTASIVFLFDDLKSLF